MAENTEIRAEDVVGIRTRVGWGAIFAGATMALAIYLVLTLLGSAIGLSIREQVEPENLGTGAAIWAVLTTIIALFVGGYVTSQCTVGENKAEAIVHGIIMWGVLFAMMLWLVASGVRSGFSALVGMASATQAASQVMSEEGWQAAARRAGVPPEQIDEWRRRAAATAANTRQAVEDERNREALTAAATQAAWWTLAGTLLSMASAVLGALVGSGPTPRLLTLAGSIHRSRIITTQQPTTR